VGVAVAVGVAAVVVILSSDNNNQSGSNNNKVADNALTALTSAWQLHGAMMRTQRRLNRNWKHQHPVVLLQTQAQIQTSKQPNIRTYVRECGP